MANKLKTWTCPFCNHKSVVLDANFQQERIVFSKSPKYENQIFYMVFIVCPNSECHEFSLNCMQFKGDYNDRGYLETQGEAVKKWNLIPKSIAKPFPDYIPKAILEDYEEACIIVGDSPKAASTLARRCLQGMIRDFWDVKGRNLYKEIEAIKDKVHPITWKAIDGVRQIGNIGAHMEKDINLIVEVDQNEASLLIELIEFLIDEWYVESHEREKKMKEIVSIAETKKVKKKNNSSSSE